jgi:hypothetical protein
VFWRFPESEKWQRRSRDILEREIVKQHSPNGVNREEASGYIQFVLDALAAAKIAEKNSNIKFSSRFNSMLKKIFRFSHDSTDVRGNLIEYGDSDDGRLTPPGFLSQKEEKKSHSSSFYTKEGHFFLKKRAGNSEIFMHFNAAPLGYLSTAAHGHADALSFSLNVDGKQYFVDPGTYIYHGEPKWREYFVGTLAHNTVRIDKADQAHFIGPTLWGKKYKGKVVAASSNSARDLIRATHNGYQKISHFRKVLFDKKSDRITITDEFLPRKKGGHVFEFCLHLHPEAQIIREGKHTFFIQRQGSRKVALYLDRRFDFQLISGDKSRPLGWYSPQLYIKVPATTIYMKNFAKEKFTINTIIEIL